MARRTVLYVENYRQGGHALQRCSTGAAIAASSLARMKLVDNYVTSASTSDYATFLYAIESLTRLSYPTARSKISKRAQAVRCAL